MAGNVAPNIIDNGLVLYLDAANTRSYPTTGTTWDDLSKSSLNGTLTNGPTFNSSNGGNIVFDGINDYVDYGTTGEDLVRGGTTLTMSVACYCTGFSNPSGGFSWAPLTSIDKYQLGNNFRKFTLYLANSSGTQSVIGEFFNGAGGTISVSNTRTVLNTYLVLTVTINPTNTKLFVNGNLVDTKGGITLNSNPQTSEFTIGSRVNTGYDGYFKGNMFNFLFYNRALTDNEVLQNYNAIKSRFGL